MPPVSLLCFSHTKIRRRPSHSRFPGHGKQLSILIVLALAVGLSARPSSGHFLVVIPQTDAVETSEPSEVDCRILFGHPMEQTPPLPLPGPVRVSVKIGEQEIHLQDKLVARQDRGGTWWQATLPLRRPGDHIVIVEAPGYWEQAERTWLVHTAKVIVHFAGGEAWWHRPVGLPVEIVPLTRPYGLWVGNCFRAQVLYRGKPAAGIPVEVEYWNEGGRVHVPKEVLLSQVVHTDEHGIFCYGIPWAGWWGFAALVDGEPRPGPDGQQARVELGGTIWIHAVSPPHPGSSDNR